MPTAAQMLRVENISLGRLQHEDEAVGGSGAAQRQHLRVTAAAAQELEQARRQVKLLLQHNQELDLRLREEAAEGPASRELRSVLQARTMHRCPSNPLRST